MDDYIDFSKQTDPPQFEISMIDVDRDQLKELLRQNKEMKEDLAKIVKVGNIFYAKLGKIDMKNPNFVMLATKIPSLIEYFKKDTELQELITFENVQRLNELYGR